MIASILQNELILIQEESPAVKPTKEISILCLVRISETGLIRVSNHNEKNLTLLIPGGGFHPFHVFLSITSPLKIPDISNS